jgi:hypothetical protein
MELSSPVVLKDDQLDAVAAGHNVRLLSNNHHNTVRVRVEVPR